MTPLMMLYLRHHPRKLQVRQPRLRRSNQEVPIPAYERCQRDAGLGQRMLDIVMRGVSTQQYPAVLPQMIRQTMDASEAVLKKLMERPLEELDLLILLWMGCVLGIIASSAPWAWTARERSMYWASSVERW